MRNLFPSSPMFDSIEIIREKDATLAALAVNDRELFGTPSFEAEVVHETETAARAKGLAKRFRRAR